MMIRQNVVCGETNDDIFTLNILILSTTYLFLSITIVLSGIQKIIF